MELYMEWTKAKKQNPDSIILYGCGAFYETYDEDADRLSQDYCLKKTTKDSNIANFPPLRQVSIPYHLIDNLIGIMLRKKVNFMVNFRQ